jgi:hypothetical protein
MYLKKWFIWTRKECIPSLARAKKIKLFNFESYDLANGKE